MASVGSNESDTEAMAKDCHCHLKIEQVMIVQGSGSRIRNLPSYPSNFSETYLINCTQNPKYSAPTQYPHFPWSKIKDIVS